MKREQTEKLDAREMQTVTGGVAYSQIQSSNSLVNYDWLKTAAAKLRASLQVLPPVGPPR